MACVVISNSLVTITTKKKPLFIYSPLSDTRGQILTVVKNITYETVRMKFLFISSLANLRHIQLQSLSNSYSFEGIKSS